VTTALTGDAAGHDNIGIGLNAGAALTTGSNNIYIGSNDGTAGENNCIRIGPQNSVGTDTCIAGIYNNVLTTTAVYIDANGHLGTTVSSRRYKQNIKTMGDVSDVILSLKPVTYQYKPQYDPKGGPQFGLVAEEVEKVCPDLVIHDKDGSPHAVRYDAVNVMLLNEFLKEHKRVDAQAQINAAQAKTIAAQQKQIETLTASMQKMTQQVEAVAQRLEGKDYQPVANHVGSIPSE